METDVEVMLPQVKEHLEAEEPRMVSSWKPPEMEWPSLLTPWFPMPRFQNCEISTVLGHLVCRTCLHQPSGTNTDMWTWSTCGTSKWRSKTGRLIWRYQTPVWAEDKTWRHISIWWSNKVVTWLRSSREDELV